MAIFVCMPQTVSVDVPMIQAVLLGTFVRLQSVPIVQIDPTLEALEPEVLRVRLILDLGR